MDNGILVFAGVIVAAVAAAGLGFALFGFVVSLKDSNRRQRSGLSAPYPSSRPPISTNSRIDFSKSIQFGDVIEGDEETYSQESYVTVNITSQLNETCPICLNSISSDFFRCPRCDTQYHHHCFSEINGPCRYCGWHEGSK